MLRMAKEEGATKHAAEEDLERGGLSEPICWKPHQSDFCGGHP